jgi:hypothetical protein
MKQSLLSTSLKIALMTGFGAFDANALLMAEVQTDDFATERTLIPEGEPMFKIGKPKINSGEKDGKQWARLTLPLECIDQDVLSELGVEKIGARYEFFLDLTENNTLASGVNQNVALGQAFEAAGLYGGEAAISQFEGRSVRGRVKIKTGDSGVAYNEVSKIIAAD